MDAGARLTDRIRADYPGLTVLWAVAGDADDERIPGYGDYWPEAFEAASSANVSEIQFNCEAAWSRRPRGSLREALLKVATKRAEIPRGMSLQMTHTAFDGPVWLSSARWGYGESYPWRECLGTGSPIVRTAPQVYWAMKKGEEMPRGRGIRREALHEESWTRAQKKGLIRGDIITDIYLQAYDCRLDELCLVAEDEPNVYWWCAPVRVDPTGVQAMAFISEMHRRGKTIQEFQTELGVTPDRLVGPKTFSAAFPSWKPVQTIMT